MKRRARGQLAPYALRDQHAHAALQACDAAGRTLGYGYRDKSHKTCMHSLNREGACLQVFDAASRTLLRQLKGHEAPVHATVFAADKLKALSGSDDSTVSSALCALATSARGCGCDLVPHLMCLCNRCGVALHSLVSLMWGHNVLGSARHLIYQADESQLMLPTGLHSTSWANF